MADTKVFPSISTLAIGEGVSLEWGAGSHPVGQCFSEGGPQANSVSIACEPVRSAESQATMLDLLNQKLGGGTHHSVS